MSESGDETKESGEQTKESGDETKESGDRTKESGERTKESGERTEESGEQTELPKATARSSAPDGTPQSKWIGVALAAMAVVAALANAIAALLTLTPLDSPWVAPGISMVGMGAVGVLIGWKSRGRPALEAALAALVAMPVALAIAPIELPPIDGRVIPVDVALAVTMIFGGASAVLLAALGAHAGVELARVKTAGEADAWDRAGAWLARNGAPYVLAAITLAVLFAHFGVFVGETVGDDLSFHFAESARIADCLRVGDFDLWNPSANAGYASAYYYQVLPQLASAIPAAIFGHHLFWFQLSVVLPLALAPAAAYRGMRLMGATAWQAVFAAFVIAFMNGQSRWGSGNAGTFQVGLYTQTWALAAFPLALGHGARWITEGKGLAPAIAWGAFVGLCHPFAVLALGFALTLPIVWQAAMSLVDRLLGALAGVVQPKTPARPAEPATTRARYDDSFRALFDGLLARWRRPPRTIVVAEIPRWAILGALMVVACMPVWLPLVIDFDGFGGFPHRVDDEVGPGLLGTVTNPGLLRWFWRGDILDFSPAPLGQPLHVITLAVLFVPLFARAKYLRWLWAPALAFAFFLALGPHLGKTQDDLLPMVRFLGAMQVVLGLAIGAGAILIGRALWHAAGETRFSPLVRLLLVAALGFVALGALVSLWTEAGFPLVAVHRLTLRNVTDLTTLRLIGTLIIALVALVGAPPLWRWLDTAYAQRTLLAALGAALAVLVAVPGVRALTARIRVMDESNHRSERVAIEEKLATLPQGRKQVGPGAENHWWNLLSYAYVRVPATLQMGGGGLQASPNYDYLWSNHDFVKNARIYDAPYLVFNSPRGASMPVGETLLKTANYELRRLPTAGLVTPVQVTGVLPPGPRKNEPGHAMALAWLNSDAPMKDQVLVYNGYGEAGQLPDGKVLRAWRQDSPGDEPDIVADVEVGTRATTFVVRESWHPRWHAYIDGVAAPVMRVTPDFSAVTVPPGKHELAMRFERPWWAQVAWLAWPGVPLGAWLVLRLLRKRRRAAPAA